MAHPFLVKMFEVILYGSSDFPLSNDGRSSEDKQNALAYMKKLESFEFIYSMVTLSRSLLYLKQAVVNLQVKNKDIVSGVSTVMQCCEDQSERILRLIPSIFICIAVELLRNQAYLYQCLEQLGVSSIVRTLKALRLQIT